MALNRSDKSRILRRYSPGMTRNSEMQQNLVQIASARIWQFSLRRLAKGGRKPSQTWSERSRPLLDTWS